METTTSTTNKKYNKNYHLHSITIVLYKRHMWAIHVSFFKDDINFNIFTQNITSTWNIKNWDI